MSKTKILLICSWITLGATIIIVDNKLYAETIAGFYVLDNILNVINKNYK